MNLAELTSPIRLYWDINDSAGVSASDCARIAEEVVSNKFLSLQITETSSTLSQACKTILAALSGKPIALSIVAPVSVLDAEAFDVFRCSSVKVVFARTADGDDLTKVANILKRTETSPATGIAFPVTRGNYQALHEVLQFCVEHEIAHFLLPMQRLMTNETCFSFSGPERKELTDRLNAIEKPSWLRITIHDPFLWRAFFPTVEFPNGGCQAANTMLYISPQGDVYPCPTLPIKLGNLVTTSLKDIITSAGKKELRKNILERPSACGSCGSWGQCRGGCRGRAYVAGGSLQGPDPACA